MGGPQIPNPKCVMNIITKWCNFYLLKLESDIWQIKVTDKTMKV